MPSPKTIESRVPAPSPTGDSSPSDALVHSLSNKLLPIVVFSELALRRCDDSELKPLLEKIHDAAEQARDLLVEIRTLHNKVVP